MSRVTVSQGGWGHEPALAQGRQQQQQQQEDGGVAGGGAGGGADQHAADAAPGAVVGLGLDVQQVREQRVQVHQLYGGVHPAWGHLEI